MIFLYYFLLVYFSAVSIFFVVLLSYFLGINKKSGFSENVQPFISVLLAVRNEERNVLTCLQALEALKYPKDKIEILIGDDLSEDNTVEIVTTFIRDKANFQLHHIQGILGKAGAKGNVLAHLAHKAKGDFFFITDADVVVPPTWIYGLLSEWKPGTATVSGSAIIRGKGLISKFQGIDWITAFGMIFTASGAGIPVTAVGNNMMIQRDAYFQSGGYENIPFSVTEDFDLHEAVRKLGWKNVNLLNPFILSRTKAIEGFGNMLQQRKRWMAGAVRLPTLLVVLLSLQAIFFPCVAIGLLLFPKLALTAWLVKFLLQNLFLFLVLRRVREPADLLFWSIFYEVYSGICSFVLIVYYFLPLKTVWKGRKYA